MYLLEKTIIKATESVTKRTKSIILQNTISDNFWWRRSYVKTYICVNNLCMLPFRHLNFRLCQSNLKVNKDKHQTSQWLQIVNLMPCPQSWIKEAKDTSDISFQKIFDRIKRVWRCYTFCFEVNRELERKYGFIRKS